MLKYYNYDIVFREVPGEVSLGIEIVNCPFSCEGCHSPHLQEDNGTYLTNEVITELLEKYNSATCVCLLGGDSDIEDIVRIAKFVKSNTNKKICWYSGRENIPNIILDNHKYFDFIKIGHYDASKGGLDSPTTNQILFNIIRV